MLIYAVGQNVLKFVIIWLSYLKRQSGIFLIDDVEKPMAHYTVSARILSLMTGIKLT